MMHRAPFGTHLHRILEKSADVLERVAARRVEGHCFSAESAFQKSIAGGGLSAVARDMAADEMFEEEYSAIVDAKRQVPGGVIADRLETGHYLWKNQIFESTAKRVAENDAPDINAAEGLYKCRKCGSTRTFSFGKQTRSSDEGTTVFVKCSSCSTSWVVGG
jgi:DNA-directed RNA polymerase subunit M/transcription elongation factor TFIIS